MPTSQVPAAAAPPRKDPAAQGSSHPAHPASPDAQAQLRAIHATSTVFYWEQDCEFRFTLDLRGRDQANEGGVLGLRRWETGAVPLSGSWEEHRRCLEQRQAFRDFEFRVGSGADARYIASTGAPVYAPDGSFAGYRGTAMDVTDLRNSRERSEQDQAFLRLASRLGRVAGWRIALPGMQATWSAEFRGLLGVEPSGQLTTADLLAMVHPRLRGELARAWQACAQGGPPLDLELPLLAACRRPRWVRLLGEARRDDTGRIASIQGAVQDVTESREDRERLRSLGDQLAAANADLTERVRERTRELERANTELKGFSHALAHDLKQPISAVEWFSIALADAIALGDAQRSAHLNGRIRAAGQRMTDYVDALLSLAETSQAPVHIMDVDLSEMAEAILDEIGRADPGRELLRAIEPGLVARADRRLVRMLLENLLGNAWKFTAGRAPAHIRLCSRAGDDGETVYVVQDNGAGFDMAYADKLFGNFQRLHSSSEFAGTGIGLANAHRIVSRHGGRIWAEARVGEGAHFSFTLAPPPGLWTRRSGGNC